jgi:hypothetical protein
MVVPLKSYFGMGLGFSWSAAGMLMVGRARVKSDDTGRGILQ